VSEDASSTSTISITYPKGGSADETVEEAGAALINRELAFKTGSGASSALILRAFEDAGATPFSSAGRTGATVGYTAAPDQAVDLVSLLGVECSFEKWDVRDAKSLAGVEIAEANSNAHVVLTESVFAAAFGGQSAMGRPYYSADASASAIESFRTRGYGLNGAVLAATGIADHAAFVAAVEEALADAPAGNADAPASSTFLGGGARVSAPSTGYAHVALGFAGPTGPLGEVVKQCLSLQGAAGFASSGLVGVYGSSDGAGASAVVDTLCTTLTTSVSADIVKRAKGLAKAQALFALDDGSQGLASAMTASVLETGTFSATDVAGAYDAITEKDVNAAIAAMLKSGPAVAAVGDIAVVPYHGTVASRFS